MLVRLLTMSIGVQHEREIWLLAVLFSWFCVFVFSSCWFEMGDVTYFHTPECSASFDS